MKIPVFLAALLATTGFAIACSCAPSPGVAESLKDSAAVFAGKVLSISPSGDDPEAAMSGFKITFAVEKSWKGIRTEKVVIATSPGGGMCGYHFEKEGRYLVYASGDKELSTGICSRTAPLDEAAGDVAQLDKLAKSAPSQR